jgi:hypothetical protein
MHLGGALVGVAVVTVVLATHADASLPTRWRNRTGTFPERWWKSTIYQVLTDRFYGPAEPACPDQEVCQLRVPWTAHLRSDTPPGIERAYPCDWINI